MAESINLELIGKTVLEIREVVRKLERVPNAVARLQDDHRLMIRMLQARKTVRRTRSG